MSARDPGPALLRTPRAWAADALILGSVAAAFYLLLTLAPRELHRSIPSITIDLRPSALPEYALLSLLRMIAAYIISLAFTLGVGYAAAHNAAAGRLIVPVLDVLQSIPVLSFLPTVLLAMIALFPGQTLGLELGSILLIFTGMVWNMAFSFYHSLLTIPEELSEATRAFRLSPLRRLASLELPASMIGLVWNSMMSWAGGWFFLMATEEFSLGKQSFTLPGLGSYLAEAANKGNFTAIWWGLGTLVALIVALDQLVWRPLIAWSEKFKVELSEGQDVPRSWALNVLRDSALLPACGRALRTISERVQEGRHAPTFPHPPALRPARAALGRALGWPAGLAAVALVLWGALSLLRLIAALPAGQWLVIGAGTGATLLRIIAALSVSLLWTIPAGVAIGLHPRLARVAQPLAQIAASVPATAVFPILLLLLIHVGGGLTIASILLILLGTQWYVLFNAIAGAIALPRDLLEATEVMKVRGWARWRTLILPGIFPHLVTGGITAQGGAFNASIVSEYVTFENKTLQTIGLGALISAAAADANYPLLAAATASLAAIVVIWNRLFWRRAARLAEERYHLG
ncbi:MAG TPA: ABC transporter permease subunit [bacterium]|nr:ABC transporter permease subunit [bacterium]